MRNNLFASLCALFLLCACNDGSAPAGAASTGSSNAAPQSGKPNTVQVYVEALNEPFIVQRPGNRIGGFEYDLLQAIAEKQGLTLEYHPVVWEELFAAMKAGKADIIASNITVTPERAEKIDFTTPHLQSATGVLVSAKTEANNFADLNNPNYIINVQGGTFSEEIAKQFWPKAQLANESSTFTQVHALVTDKANAAVGDMYILSYYSRREHQHNLRVLTDESQAKEDIAFGVRKGQPELLKQLNDGLAAIRADGTYDRLVEQWFGKNLNAAQPQTPTN